MFIRTLMIYLAIFIVLFSGCGVQKQMIVTEKKEMPSWYVNPPKSNQTELYALGYGKDKKSATTDALAQMLSTLSVSISSKFSGKTVVREGNSSSSSATYIDESQSEVKKIRISNYEIVKAQSLGFKKYAVLVTSNKKKLFKSMQQELKQNFLIIDKRKKIVAQQNLIKQIVFYKNAKNDLSSLPNKLLVMNELESGFDGTPYLSKYNSIEATYERLLSSITFGIKSNYDAKNLKAPLAKGISAKKLKISDAKGKNHFLIKIDSRIEEANAYGFTLARSAIAITVQDYKGNTIGSNKFNLIGQSTQGFAIAKENVAIKLSQLIKKDGIEKVIGLAL
ncbi:MAG: LPP20 family lipoprotein [Sulfurimonas sp.]